MHINHLRFSSFVIVLLCSFAVYAQTNITNRCNPQAMNAWVDSVMLQLSPQERLGQLIIPIITNTDNQKTRTHIKQTIERYHIGGILFSTGTIDQQARLTDYAQKTSPTPLLITQDGEWGLNMRLKDAIRFPRNMALGCINSTIKTIDGNQSQRDSLLYEFGLETARQFRQMGIHVNFAPVLDINSNPDNPVIGNRAFGETIGTVVSGGVSYAAGLEDGNVLAVGKHFPGHGDTDKDSHKTLPKLAHDIQRLKDFEMKPFEHFCDIGFGGIMVAHLEVPALDSTSGIPASMSKDIVEGQLREQLGFKGLVFTDGLAMQGARTVSNASTRALLAGSDVLLDPTPLASQWQSLQQDIKNGTLPQTLIDEKCRRVLCYKYALQCHESQKQDIAHPSLIDSINSPKAQLLAKDLYINSLVLLRNEPITDNGKPTPIIPFNNLEHHSFHLVTIGNIDFSPMLQTMQSYTHTTHTNLPTDRTDEHITKALQQIDSTTIVVIAIRDRKKSSINIANQLCQKLNNPFVLCFYTSPYSLESYSSVINQSKAVLLAHEEYPIAQQVAGEGLFGGTSIRGKLSVTIPKTFQAGAGFDTPRIRISQAVPEKVGMKTSILERIDSIADAAIKQEAFPGCQILVAKDGYIIYNKAFGKKTYHPKSARITPQTIYDLASVSKAAATLPALMMITEQYDIPLDTRLSTYITQLQHTDKEDITLEQALYHETGIRDSYPFYGMAIDSSSIRNGLYRTRPDATFSLRQDKKLYFNRRMRWNDYWISRKPNPVHCLQVADSLYVNPLLQDSILRRIADLPLRKNKNYRYSCLNFVLIRHFLENISQTSLDAYLHHNLFAPLGASSLCYNPKRQKHIDVRNIAPTERDNAIRRQLIQGYVHDEIAAFSGGVEGNAGLFGSAQDLVKVLQTILNNGQYANRQYISATHCQRFTQSLSPHSRRGLGFDKPDTNNPDQSPTSLECSPATYGHTGYTGTCFWIDPTHNLIYIFLCNRVYPHRWNNKLTQESYRTNIQSIIYESFLQQ